MLLDDKDKILRILLGYQFHFSVGIPDGYVLTDCGDNHPCALHGISSCCYRTSKNISSICRNSDGESVSHEPHAYIESYKRNVVRRINSSFRTVRDSLTIKIDDIPISSITIGEKRVNSLDRENVFLTGIISIQTIGVCTVSLWFENLKISEENEWRNIIDPSKVQFTTSYAGINKSSWKTLDFIRFLQLKCHETVNSDMGFLSDERYQEYILDDKRFVKYIMSKYKGKSFSPISYDCTSYPIIFIQYNMSNDEIKTAVNSVEKIRDFRLVLYGDFHWKLKTDDVIQSTVVNVNITTRNSIAWYVTSQGMLKIASVDINNETSIEESFTTALLETDLVLTMRYFLSSIMLDLSRISDQYEDPIAIDILKENIFESMDKYFNINVSQNDQTMKRIEKLERIFYVDHIYSDVRDRIEILSTKIANENSDSIERQQVFLTIIFGLFGSIQVLYPFFQELLKDIFPDYVLFIFSTTASLIIASLIWYITKRIKSKRK